MDEYPDDSPLGSTAVMVYQALYPEPSPVIVKELVVLVPTRSWW